MKIMTYAHIGKVIFFVAYLLLKICTSQEVAREPKLSIFNIIKFQNDPCIGTSRNGTCLTAAECDDAGGQEMGDCADGFGVCCVTIIPIGGATNLNQSYIVQSSAELTNGGHEYNICPCSSDICRIKFDFNSFTLVGPFGGQGSVLNALFYLAPPVNEVTAIGDCVEDTFSITSSSGPGSPVICGVNTGQHMIIDADGSSCIKVNLGIGGQATTTTRALDIMMTQYRCGEEMGGPPGCLQWFTTNTGNVRSFNFPATNPGGVISGATTHLSNQHYTSCIRQPLGTTYICYIACTNGGVAAGGTVLDAANAVTDQGSFGLSLSPNAAAKSATFTNCATDYIGIPGGTTEAIAKDAAAALNGATQLGVANAVTFGSRYCGRTFDTETNLVFNAVGNSVCTNSVPFVIDVETDDDEGFIGNADSMNSEAHTQAGAGAGGIVGFSLCYIAS